MGTISHKLRLSKKGIVFTLTIILVSALVFSLAIVYKNVGEENSITFSNVMVMDRVHDLGQSINEVMAQIIFEDNLFGVNCTNGQLLVNAVAGSQDSLQLFKDFANSQDFINISIDEMSLGNLTGNLVELSYSGNITNDDGVSVYAGAVPYVITIETTESVQQCQWSVVDGDFPFRLIVVDPDGVACDDTRSIDLYGENEVRVQGNRYIIDISNGGVLNVTNGKEGVETLDLTIEAPVGNTTSDFRVNGEVINISFSDFGISRKSGISLFCN